MVILICKILSNVESLAGSNEARSLFGGDSSLGMKIQPGYTALVRGDFTVHQNERLSMAYLLAETIMQLRSGDIVTVTPGWMFFTEEGYPLGNFEKNISLTENVNVTLPKNGQMVLARSIRLHANGNIARVDFVSTNTVLTPIGKLTIPGISFHSDGNISGAHLPLGMSKAPKILLPNGDKAEIYDNILFAPDGQISRVHLLKPTKLRLPDGRRVELPKNSYVFFGTDGRIEIIEQYDFGYNNGKLISREEFTLH